MTDAGCDEMRLLLQADVDGELAPAEAARVAAHVARCAACAEAQARLLALSQRLRDEVPYHSASDALRAAVHAHIAAATPNVAHRSAARTPRWRRLPRLRVGQGAAFGGGFALAACLALALVLPRAGDNLPATVVADHIRALQPGHLEDVASTDQHTVKPWFDGRIDFAPPVKDLKADGFPLVGGRLDYLANRPVAALVYQRRKHVIDLFVWPDTGPLAHGTAEGSRNGYNFVRWHQDGMAFWAVSDLNAKELADFARRWRAET
ncbi:MAG: anti-sigma factor [Acetobacteraceae bacterium]|nr:anti-sigma factor [Acetobacteraceae bacterium]